MLYPKVLLQLKAAIRMKIFIIETYVPSKLIAHRKFKMFEFGTLLHWTSTTSRLNHGQATDMDMKAFEDFWKIFAIGNFK